MVEGVDLPNDGFGGKNTISLDVDVAAVGAPGAESVFLFYRTASAAAGGGGGLDWAWGQGPVETLVSSDFDYDVVHLLKIIHRQVGCEHMKQDVKRFRRVFWGIFVLPNISRDSYYVDQCG